MRAEAVSDWLIRLIDPAVRQALLIGPEINVSDEENAAQSARRLSAVLLAEGIVMESQYDSKNERYRLMIKRTQHGNLHQTALDEDYVQSGD